MRSARRPRCGNSASERASSIAPSRALPFSTTRFTRPICSASPGETAGEALQMGLVNRVVEKGKALEGAMELARSLAEFPQRGLRADRMSLYEQWALPWNQARANELRHGLKVM